MHGVFCKVSEVVFAGGFVDSIFWGAGCGWLAGWLLRVPLSVLVLHLIPTERA